MQAEPSADSVSKSYARDAWMVRAALEDRQEAAPCYCCRPYCVHDGCECNNAMPDSGVPSEATPTKEFIGTVRRRLFIPVDHEWNGVVREVTAKHESGEMVPVTAVLDDLAAFYRRRATLAMLKSHLNGEETVRFFADNSDLKNPLPQAAPAPEVQGTPEFNLETTLAALQEEQDKFAAEHPDIVAAASARGTDGGSGMAAQNSRVGTPQKETPPDFTCEECDSHCCITAGGSKLICYHCYLAKAAPAPEVQGTPTRQDAPEFDESDWADTWYSLCRLVADTDEEWHGAERQYLMSEFDPWPILRRLCVPYIAAPEPVGTPQKETPTMPYGAGAQNFGAVPEGVQGLEPKTTPRRKCGKCGAKTYWHGDTWYHCDGADVAKCGAVDPQTPPEGVQGKEPPHETPGPKQAPTEYQQVSRQIMARMRELHIPIPEGDCGPLQFFNAACASREAAGRRSAITKFEKWAESQKSGLDEEATGKIMDWCAELQEKTK